MRRLKIVRCVMVVGGCVGAVVAQDEAETCYGPGSVVGAVVGTLIITLGLLASAFFLYRIYWKTRKVTEIPTTMPGCDARGAPLGSYQGKHLVLMTDAENPHDQYAFDNPCFREATSVKHVQDEKQSSKVEKTKWVAWPPVHTFGKEQKSEKLVSMDDSCVKDARLKVVTLQSHDFTGLGFNICGNMRDGIFVKDVLHRGPAFESGCINTGDRIDSVCISFRNMVFEDALTILSYASPYDVQVQLESDSCSRPSTLMRSKRESNAVNCSDRILHPKFARSQSVSHLNEIGSSNNRKAGQQAGLIVEKNRRNNSMGKWQEFGDYPTIKVSKSEKMSPPVGNKESGQIDGRNRATESQQTKWLDSQNKLHKFGIKVLPLSISPKMGLQSGSGAKKVGNDTSEGAKPKELSRTGSPVDEKLSVEEESDGSKENVKGMLAKGFLSLKEKINQNTLGRKKRSEEENRLEEGDGARQGGGECPVPRRRSSVTCGMKAQEQTQESQMNVPEEVFRAGDIARTQRKSVAEGRSRGEELQGGGMGSGGVAEEGASGSEECSDRESLKDESRRPKRSKGKAPLPPKANASSNEINEIKSERELLKQETRIFEPETKTPLLKAEEELEQKRHTSYDSDSDTDPLSAPKDSPNTKIELSATQVTVHHCPVPDGNDDDVEPSRKAASLGDLSRLDSDQPLSIVLERAVSLDLTEGSTQCAKKRKAPLPPSEEFPAAFDDRSYRKEPRLEGLTTFQRRLKKSSDFGTLEDALHDDSKPSDTEHTRLSPPDFSQALTHNIQEFSSWLAECRRPKPPENQPPPTPQDNPKLTATSFVNINSTDPPDDDSNTFHAPNVSFRVNGTNFQDFDVPGTSENNAFSAPTSRTVVVISQPNSLEPAIIDTSPCPSPAPAPTSTSTPIPVPTTAPAPIAPTPTPDPHTQTTNGPNRLPDSVSPPSPKTLSSPLSSSLTYVTEIKVSTPEHPSPTSVAERIHTFHSLAPSITPFPKTLSEPSKIPIRTMKSETGQRVLATIQSLTKESSSPTKTPKLDYAKRVASLFSNPHRAHPNLDSNELLQTDSPPLNVSGLYLDPSKGYFPSRKVPPVVPPRRIETSTVTLGLPALSPSPSPSPQSPDTNVVTFSSFVGRNQSDASAHPPVPSKISFNVRRVQDHPEMNGRQDDFVSLGSSADSRNIKDDF